MRQETGNPDFQYELVCNKVCGKAHFSMKSIIIVDEKEDYERWRASQESWLSKNPEYLAKIEQNSPVESVATKASDIESEGSNTSL